MANYYPHAKVPMPNRNGFNMDHSNLLTLQTGYLTPVLCCETLPNETYNLKHALQCQLPPMATDFYGSVHVKLEAFFVPNRIIWGGWQDFISQKTTDPILQPTALVPTLPGAAAAETFFRPGTLSDYLGFKYKTSGHQSTNLVYVNNLLPFVAYHKIFDDWYRDSKIQVPLFLTPGATTSQSSVYTLPWTHANGRLSGDGLKFYDGLSVFALRQRNYPKDYFLNCTPRPQSIDSPSVVGFNVMSPPSSDNASTLVGTGAFTIAQLRTANALQEFLERNNIAGNKYSDSIRAHFGCYPADAITDRAIYLGSDSIGVYNKAVYQSHTETSSSGRRNPFTTVGAKFGVSQGYGEGGLIDNFHCTEHGHIIVIASLVPDSYYDTGVRRMFSRSSATDFAFPELAGVGDQPLYLDEIDEGFAEAYYGVSSGTHSTFGYTQRYAEYKYMPDEVHGLLRGGMSLENFALKRSFASTPNGDNTTQISTSAIQIPNTALDDVTAVASSSSDYGAWIEIAFQFRKVSPLVPYTIPTLGASDTHMESIPVNGSRL